MHRFTVVRVDFQTAESCEGDVAWSETKTAFWGLDGTLDYIFVPTKDWRCSRLVTVWANPR